MFTGLVTDVGTIERVSETPAGRELHVRCTYTDLEPGESVAMNGACLTVLDRGDGWFTVAAVTTTLERTTISTWRQGKRANNHGRLQYAIGPNCAPNLQRRMSRPFF